MYHGWCMGNQSDANLANINLGDTKMFKYMLTKQVWESRDYGKEEVLGIFDRFDDVNEFLRTSGYPSNIKFFTCRQIIEVPLGGTNIRLDLTSVPFNPISKIGELKQFFEEEPTIAEFEERNTTQPDFLEYKKKGYSVHTYFDDDSMSLQFWGWAIVLKEDGIWFWEDTSGG